MTTTPHRPAVSILLLTALAGPAVSSPPAERDLTTFARQGNAFGLDLWKWLPASGNQAFSPASIATALAMTWGGARGETAAEMQRVLRLQGSPADAMEASGRLDRALTDPKRPVVLRIANRLFGEARVPFEASFLSATKAAYGAALEPLAFAAAPEKARAHINGWVEAETERRIKDLIPRSGITEDTRLVLANALYFQGDWQDPFEKESTRPAPFRLSSTESKDVPTMCLSIGDVFHKAVVKADEKGTEAAAATAVMMMRATGMPLAPAVEFKADHPFLFLIRDHESGAVLFLGRVADPQAN